MPGREGLRVALSPYAGRVGELIQARRAELELTQGQLADRVGASVRTVGNIERGVSAVAVLNRPQWEAALGWPAGSLTTLYRRGVMPDEGPGPGGGTPGASVLDQAGVPAEYREDPTVREVLAADIDPARKVEMLRVWVTQRVAISHWIEGFRRGQKGA